MKKLSLVLLIIFALSLIHPSAVSAQTYYFSVDSATVDVYFNADGSTDLVYVYGFSNDPKLRPLSTQSDVLHSWPEYFDQENKKDWYRLRHEPALTAAEVVRLAESAFTTPDPSTTMPQRTMIIKFNCSISFPS